ncbi:hypothetical protein [uncultured Thiodictyon sp.]|uniref:hypothetical protein n=1 Tax=uncultured Thiodictyon sp. TaxID=1846217 RepID=UPI0025E9F049|nr:hypothetical protein [uncultured Thiodictyon sp.]
MTRSSQLLDSNAYPGMQTRRLWVNGRVVKTDSEGYLVNPANWSAAFASVQAESEGPCS